MGSKRGCKDAPRFHSWVLRLQSVNRKSEVLSSPTPVNRRNSLRSLQIQVLPCILHFTPSGLPFHNTPGCRLLSSCSRKLRRNAPPPAHDDDDDHHHHHYHYRVISSSYIQVLFYLVRKHSPFSSGAFLPACCRRDCGAPGEGGRLQGSKCCKSGIRACAKTGAKERELECPGDIQ